MRSLVLLPVALLAVSAGVAQGGELPKRRPGLWELSWYSNDVTPSQAAVEPSITKMCIDAATDEKLAAALDPCDPPLDFAFFAPQFTKEVVCEAPVDANLKAVSRAQITYTGDTAYRIEVRTHFEPQLKNEGEISGGREGKWVGACPADMRPGDLVVGDQPKRNVLEEIH